MAQHEKRSVSLPVDLAAAIDAAAAEDSATFSAWIADASARRLRIRAGRRALAEWEAEQGPLTMDEVADGLARARALLGRTGSAGPRPA